VKEEQGGSSNGHPDRHEASALYHR
jgi:hypothetical protein